MSKTVKIASIYPTLLGTYGDGGNVAALRHIAALHGITVSVDEVSPGQKVPANADIYVLGGGEDTAQSAAAAALHASGALAEGVKLERRNGVIGPGQWGASVTAGGGGYGDPARRAPEAMQRDLLDGYVTPQAAQRDLASAFTGPLNSLRSTTPAAPRLLRKASSETRPVEAMTR